MTDRNRPEESWPDTLDALVAAPGQHRVLLENDRVRVLDTRIAPGARTPVHVHRWSSVLHILSWSHFIRYDDRGNVLLDSRNVEALKTPPAILWSAALPPHWVENVGQADLHVISVELKGDAA